MMDTIRRLILLASVVSMPFVIGCFGAGSSNPVGTAPLAQVDGSVVAQADNPAIAAAKFLSNPTSSKKKYSYSESPCSVSHEYKSELSKRPGSLRVRFCANSQAESIFLTLDDMKVKAYSGKPYKVSLDPREIDLKQATALTQVLGELALPTGNYKYLEFVVKSGRVVISGESFPLTIPSNRVRFLGNFSIKDGFSTELTIKFLHKLVRVNDREYERDNRGEGDGRNGDERNGDDHDGNDRSHHEKGFKYVLHPVVKISSTLVPLAPPTTVTVGEISGIVLDYVKKTPVSGLNVSISGSTSLTTTSDAAGAFQFKDLLAGIYTLTLSSADYLTKTVSVEVLAGQVAVVNAELNPAVIRSSVGNTGWFSQYYPLANAHGTYGEVALEAPVTIDFVSLAFIKAEVSFDSEYHGVGGSRFNTYLSSTQQVTIITNLGGWWVGNNALLGSLLGQFYATNPFTHNTVDVTDYVRTNPSAAYFLAAKNTNPVDIRLSNIQMAISYR